jgi:hypothetical protein
VAANVLSEALDQIARARTNVGKLAGRQVRNVEQRAFLRALAFAWFQSHRPAVASEADASALSEADAAYRTILNAAEKQSTKKAYLNAMASAKAALITLRGQLVVGGANRPDETTPDFSALAADAAMRGILERRWDECRRCIAAGAPLAGIVMMGGLLEALFVARANKLKDKTPLFKAASAPIDPKTRKALDLREWTLRPYLDVGHELGWITRSAKDIAAVLRDYRNYVHPEKERSHGIVLGPEDAGMLWQVTRGLVRQLLVSATGV